jgi:hypothetical protein
MERAFLREKSGGQAMKRKQFTKDHRALLRQADVELAQGKRVG